MGTWLAKKFAVLYRPNENKACFIVVPSFDVDSNYH